MTRKKEKKLSPLIVQYQTIKKQFPDEILFFRMGDFYEMMYEDAIAASAALGITLTKRGRGTASEAPMCGVPFHAAEGYIAKMIRKGFRVAICEQVEDPKATKGLVKREVVKVITPGTVLDEQCLEGKEFQYLVSLVQDERHIGLAFLEFSTGRFEVIELNGPDRLIEAGDLLVTRDPVEILIPEETDLSWLDPGFLQKRCKTEKEAWRFSYDYARTTLLDHFKAISLAGFGLEKSTWAVRAAGGALHYVQSTQKGEAKHIQDLKVLQKSDHMVLDGTTLRNLEVVRSLFDGNRTESLLGQIDMTMTAMGGRLLKEWLLRPLIDVEAIRSRQAFVTSYLNATIARQEMREILKKVPDLDRQNSKLAMGSINPRELLGIGLSLKKIPEIVELMDEIVPDRYQINDQDLSHLWQLCETIDQQLVTDPPTHTRNGGVLARGVNQELDELRSIRKDSRSTLAELEAREREATGISKLKVQYNKVFGYYIEVSKIHSSKVPAHYVRKQTLVNSERYITDELKTYEEKILGAEEKILVLEDQLYRQLVAQCQASLNTLRKWALVLALVDVHGALAELAAQKNYCLPEISDGDALVIKDGRHPVVESLGSDPFIANDTFLNTGSDRLNIITGPNMGGKSTYLRQVALIVLLAQAGSYVPATSAEIGVVDRIFTRVGASDHLARGQSTFMVEMTETANILHHATKNSLIILDEIGRGTSTFDGLAIAWSTAEYIHDSHRIGAKTLFATHYHEMTELEKLCEGVVNRNITVREWKNDIIFLRRIEKGSADQSYGVHVGQLAGLPKAVVRRAREILHNLEKNELDTTGNPRFARRSADTQPQEAEQLSLFPEWNTPFLDELKELDLDNLTPRQALNLLYDWKEQL
ncbi:MAG: DNA mismatch repair protein MutS [Acidobacteria bacterium]|nr:MAG: DNA mismatch repair protein MutS [Acidobacteriota bacterium]